MKQTSKIELTGLGAYSNPVDALKSALNKVPSLAGATYSISCSQGDRPWESDSFTITIEWEVKEPKFTGWD